MYRQPLAGSALAEAGPPCDLLSALGAEVLQEIDAFRAELGEVLKRLDDAVSELESTCAREPDPARLGALRHYLQEATSLAGVAGA